MGRSTFVMRFLRFGLPLLTLLAGCGSASQSASTATSTPSGRQALVTYSKSGGIAGIIERLKVEPSGHATVSEGLPADAKTKTFSLSPEELSKLRQTLDAAKLASHASASPQGCADCFVYRIAYRGTTFEGDQATLPAAVRPAVEALDALTARAGVDRPLIGK